MGVFLDEDAEEEEAEGDEGLADPDHGEAGFWGCGKVEGEVFFVDASVQEEGDAEGEDESQAGGEEECACFQSLVWASIFPYHFPSRRSS